MNQETQAFCYMAGASSIFAGDKLLTTPNPDIKDDLSMFKELGIEPKQAYKKQKENHEVEGKEGKIKWSRPGHKIERNVRAQEKAKKEKV